MEDNSGAKRLVESRFRFYINLLYVGGLPTFKPSVSKLYQVYSIFCYISVYTKLIAMMLEICFHTQDLDHIMDIAMLLLLFLGTTFVQFYLRYCRY
jgi:hypothetical protein